MTAAKKSKPKSKKADAEEQEQSSEEQEQNSEDQADDSVSEAEGFTLDEQTAEQLRSQVSQATQPLMQDLARQISEVVKQHMSEQNVSSEDDQSSDDSSVLESLGAPGEFIQDLIDSVVEFVQKLIAWIQEQFEKLTELVADAIGSLAAQMVKKAVKSAF